MTCYHPLSAIKITDGEGKVKVQVLGQAVWYRDRYGKSENYLELPCGSCLGCRLHRARDWAFRCVHEASLYDDNCFLTLTYNDENVPSDGSLHKDHLQKFWKRLRRSLGDVKIRYFACGEYGSKFQRPHFHACIFGWSPADKQLYTVRAGSRLYISPLVGRCWPFGYHTIGDVTFDSAAYVARYVTKKVNGEKAEDHYKGRQPEFIVMSRKPGIAHDWLLKYYDDVYPHDYLVLKDKVKCRPPKYYDQIYDVECNGDLEYIKNKRSDPKFHDQISFDDLDRLEHAKKALINTKKRRKYEESI